MSKRAETVHLAKPEKMYVQNNLGLRSDLQSSNFNGEKGAQYIKDFIFSVAPIMAE